ncbi:MAG: NADH-quinone oxidoreductase subunit I [bacterium]
MTARVVVLKSPRRRAFEIFWTLPAWTRALVVGWRRNRGRSVSSSARPPFDPTSGRSVPRSMASPADPRRTGAPDGPGLLWTSGSTGHRCTGWGLCVEICPGSALRLECVPPEPRAPKRVGEPGPPVRRFELRPGRCIACGLCIDICPEAALVPVTGRTRTGVGSEPAAVGIVDLLQVAS